MGKKSPEITAKLMQFFVIMIFMFGFLIAIIMMVFIPENEERRSYYITVCEILGGLIICAIIGLIASIVFHKRRKKSFAEEREKRLQRAADRRLATLLQETDALIDESKRERLGTGKKPHSLITKREYNISNYNGEMKNKICSICKLAVRKKQQIVQCNKCLNIFHKKHLEEWLEKKDSCPVCKEDIVETVAIV